jgi:hypothetical protein
LTPRNKSAATGEKRFAPGPLADQILPATSMLTLWHGGEAAPLAGSGCGWRR